MWQIRFTISIIVRFIKILEDMKTTKYTKRAAAVAGYLIVAGISGSEAGTLAMPDPLNFTPGVNSFSVTVAANTIEWFSFSVPTILSPDHLDITVGTGGLFSDPKIALYTAPGGTLLIEDDNGAPGFLNFDSLLSFGDASAPGGGVNGSLLGGSYYLAVGTSSVFGIFGGTNFTPDAALATSTGPAFSGTIGISSTVPAAVPEPARAGLLLLGLCAAGGIARKRR